MLKTVADSILIPLRGSAYLAAAALALVVIAPMPALAQGDPVIDLTPILQPVLGIVGALLGLVAMWAIRQGADMLGVKAESEIMHGLQDIVGQGVAYAERRAKNAISGTGVAAIDVENQKVADAANYVLTQAPKWLKKVGVTEAQVQQWVESMLDTPERDKARGGAKAGG
jgi:hypothetical protein